MGSWGFKREFALVTAAILAVLGAAGCGGGASRTSIPATGTTGAQLTLNPSTANFGNVSVGTSATQSMGVTNTGKANLTISQISASGAGFNVLGVTLPLNLSPGQSSTYTAKFAPTSMGSASGQISFTSNASNSPSVPLSGNGVSAPSHSVALSWDGSTSSGVVGFNVYRAPQSGGPFTLMNNALVSITVFTDSGVQAGGTYFYVVTAVDASFLESTYSNEVQAMIPTP